LIGAVLTTAAEPGDHERRQDAEHDFGDDGGDPVADAATAAFVLAAERAVNQPADDAGEEDHERVQDALKQGERHHVAIGDVRDLVPEHRLDLGLVHAAEQARADGDESVVLGRTRGERVHFRRVVDGHFRHGDARLLRLAPHGFQQPRLVRVARLVDHLRAGGPLRHPLRDQQRNERAAEAEHGGHHQQRPVVRQELAVFEDPCPLEYREHDVQDEQDRKVGDNQ
jgi:hypothetical protein